MKRPTYIFPNNVMNYIKYFAVLRSVYILCIYLYINLRTTAFDARQRALTRSIEFTINHFIYP